MATEVLMPQLGLTMKEGLITEWKKHEGDAVERGDQLFSVENDKAILDVDAQADGILARIIVHEMTSALVGTAIAIIAAPGEVVTEVPVSAMAPAPLADVPAGKSVPFAAPSPAAAPAVSVAPGKSSASALGTSAQQVDGFVLASPLARKTAERLGVRLSDVRGSGPEGAVLARDLPEAGDWYAMAKTQSGVLGAAQSSSVSYDDITLSRIQCVSAERMADSWTNIPQFTLYDEAEASLILTLAERFKNRGEPVSLTVIIAKLMAHAVAKHPRLNASWLGDGMVRAYRSVNINIAVDTEDGLMVPVLRDCTGKGFVALGAEMKSLEKKAKSKSLEAQDHEGGTITLSNLGMFGIKRFCAIVNPPQAAILAVGSVNDKIVGINGSFEVHKVIEYSITADHRVIDGACAARFMATLRSMLENPALAME
ncbi:MAG: 2-oxo acid dehydrogenase subunit E2 [Spirochaetales bacterium]|nr:MAG: 2-oxo acid dehydrogenase subunit E2 [Spirochaetales bacterium]